MDITGCAQHTFCICGKCKSTSRIYTVMVSTDSELYALSYGACSKLTANLLVESQHDINLDQVHIKCVAIATMGQI